MSIDTDDLDLENLTPGNLDKVPAKDYSAFVGIIISGELEYVSDSFGRLASMLSERPLGRIKESLDNVRIALTDLLDSVVEAGVETGLVDDEFVTGYEAIKGEA